MSEENAPQKERFLREVEQQLLRKELDAKLLEDGLIHVRWNKQPLCSVDRDGIVRFRPADITGPEVDRQLRTVIQTAGHVKEYMRIFERAPTLKVVGLDDTYKVLADFGDAVLAGRSCKTGAKFGSAVAIPGAWQDKPPQSLVTPAFAGLSPIAESGTKVALTTGMTTDRKSLIFTPTVV